MIEVPGNKFNIEINEAHRNFQNKETDEKLWIISNVSIPEEFIQCKTRYSMVISKM